MYAKESWQLVKIIIVVALLKQQCIQIVLASVLVISIYLICIVALISSLSSSKWKYTSKYTRTSVEQMIVRSCPGMRKSYWQPHPPLSLVTHLNKRSSLMRLLQLGVFEASAGASWWWRCKERTWVCLQVEARIRTCPCRCRCGWFSLMSSVWGGWVSEG